MTKIIVLELSTRKPRSKTSWTREIAKEYRKEYYIKKYKDPEYMERVRAYGREYQDEHRRFHRYGITNEEYEYMLMSQSFKCLLCDCGLTGGRQTHIDHNHKTGVVRGILCSSCNRVVGRIENNPGLLEKIADYLGAMTQT
jgi:hypothetical protein